ncbi:MAG: TIGR04255 family protein [Acidiferrobacter sp.]
MTQAQQYSKPPITEAVISILFEDPIGESELLSLQKALSRHYAHSQPIKNLHVKLQAGGGADLDINQEHEAGSRFSSPDMTELLILFPKSFTVSQLPPYPGWDTVFARFCRDWRILRKRLGFKTVQRVGVRYINRVDIPVEGGILAHEQYLNVFPRVTAEFGPLNAYSVQAQIYMQDLKAHLIINSASVPSPLIGYVSFIIDQDIGRVIDVPQKDDEIFNLISQVRHRKNAVFESCITEKARGLFGNDGGT